MSNIFISYSHEDLNSAQKIVDALAEHNLDTWIDWKSIPKGEDWWEHIQNGIQEANVFLFIVSPDSASSDVCNDEINHAVANGKRILPVVIRDVRPGDIHPEISKRNWIFWRKGKDDFNTALEQSLETIHADYEWLKHHTQIQVKAIAWEQAEHDASRLLRGKELREADEKLSGAESNKDPQPTDLQRQFVLTSRRNEETQRRRLIIGLGLGLVITIFLSVFAWIQRNEANSQRAIAETASTQAIAQQAIAETASTHAIAQQAIAQTKEAEAVQQSKIAHSRELAAIAINQLSIDQERSLLIALAANEQEHTLEANDSLRRALQAFQVRSVLQRCPTKADSEEDQILELSYAFSTDGNKLAIFCDLKPRQIRILEVASGETVSAIPVPDNVALVFNFYFSADGSTFVYMERGFGGGILGGIAKVWDVVHNEQIFATPDIIWGTYAYLSEGGSRVWLFSPDGDGKGPTAFVYDTFIQEQIARIPLYNISSPLGEDQIGVASATGLAIYNMTSLTKKEIGLNDNQEIENFGGKNKVLLRENNLINVLNYDTGQVEATLTFGSIPPSVQNFSVRISPDATKLAFVYDNLIEIRSLDNPQSVQLLSGHESPIGFVGFSEDSTLLISTSLDTTCRIWDIPSGKLISTINKVLSARISPDKMHLVLHMEDGNLIVWDMMNRGEVTSANVGQPLSQAWFSEDGQQVYVVTDAGNTLAWNWLKPESGLFAISADIPVAPSKLSGKSPDGNFTAALDENNTLKLYQAGTSNLLLETRVSADRVNDLQFSPDSSMLVMSFGSQFVSNVLGDFGWLPFRTPGELDQTASLWDLGSMEQISILRGSRDAVTSAVFSPDSKYVLTASSDGYVRLYLAKARDLELYAKSLIVRSPPDLTCEERVEFLKENLVCPVLTASP